MVEAIRRTGLIPSLIPGDPKELRFRREKFCSIAAALLRSGFPFLMSGELEDQGGHVVCAVGFRETAAKPDPGMLSLQDEALRYLYIHDDNLGPNIRFEVKEEGKGGPVFLEVSAPRSRRRDSAKKILKRQYARFFPEHLLVGMPDGIRLLPGTLQKLALIIGTLVRSAAGGGQAKTAVVTTRYVRCYDYADALLGKLLAKDPPALRKARLGIAEQLPAMSLSVGLVRIAIDAPGDVFADVLVDCTEAAPTVTQTDGWNAFGALGYSAQAVAALEAVKSGGAPLGKIIAVR